jgi:hypothetical protein
MKIKEFSITRYGPLPDTGRILLDNFNLFFGKNEDGKTLTIDAVVKLLLGRKNIRDFEHIDRVEENPEGYVIIKDEKGKEIKLPEEGNLTKIANLTPSECCNIFIVRNSNLSIARDVVQESEFYTNVTDRLTGLRTKDISSIKKKLQELGRLTRAESSAEFSDKKEFGNIKSRLNSSSKLLGEIDILQEKIKEEKFDILEEESVKHREEIEGIKQEIKTLENARKREKYEKGKESLDKLIDTSRKFENLEIYNEYDKQSWRDCEKDVKTYNEEKEKHLIPGLQKNEEEFKETNKKLSEAERDFQVFDGRKKTLDNEIRPELNNYVSKSGEFAQQEKKSKFFNSMGIISSILFGISLLGVIFNPSLLCYILIVLFSILTMISGIFKFQFVKDKAWLAKEFERNKLTLSKFGLDAEDIEGIFSNIQRFDEEYNKKSDELQEIKRKKENLEEKINELQNKTIPNIEKKIKDAEDKINEIKIKSGERTLEEYSKKLDLRWKLERSIEEQKSVLKSHFGEKSEKLEENISQWNEDIRNFEEYKDKAKEIKYSETTSSELDEKKHGIEENLEGMNNRMVSLQKEMEDVQRKANEILEVEEEYLYCKTSVDLTAVKDKLQEFLDGNESNKTNVLETIKIFEEIEIEEKEKVSELFGKGSSISKYFNEITGGLYQEVTFSQETGKIGVKRIDGEILEAEKLSGGTYDQLYFSIRLALGEKLLKGNKGFFIMDDPFIKADPIRLQRQIETLKKISKLEWQIMYFSAKGEINDVFKGDVDNGTINYIKLRGIFS